MDIVGLSMGMSLSKIQNDFGIAMLKKNLDMADTVGNELVDMIDSASMERSIAPYIGGNIDLTV